MRKLFREIITPRLTLRLMTEDFLEASLKDNLEETESLIGLKISPDWLEAKQIGRIRLNNYRDDSEYVKWGLRAIGLRETNEMVGYIGFHTKPNPEYLSEIAPNAIEFGFTIFSHNRRQGFAQEAAIGLMNWATEQFP
jgi:[ribosomal protein S5]-alanine N-acetyltransferase